MEEKGQQDAAKENVVTKVKERTCSPDPLWIG